MFIVAGTVGQVYIHISKDLPACLCIVFGIAVRKRITWMSCAVIYFWNLWNLIGFEDLLWGLEFLNKYLLSLITRKFHVFAIYEQKRKGRISLHNHDLNQFLLIITQILDNFCATVSWIFSSEPYIALCLAEFCWSKQRSVCVPRSELPAAQHGLSGRCFNIPVQSYLKTACEYFHWLKWALDQNQRLFQWVFHHTLLCWVHTEHLHDFSSSSGKYNVTSRVNWSLATYFPSLFIIQWQTFKMTPCTQEKKSLCHLWCSGCGFCILWHAECKHCFMFIRSVSSYTY